MCILNGKSGSFLFTWLHFLLLLLLYCLSCVFFLCAFFSHVDSYKRLRCTARIETIHHEILQTACPSVHTKSPFSFTLMLVPMCLGSSSILTSSYWDPSSSQRLSSLHRMRSCFFFFFFWCSTCWKVYLCAHNISYISCLLSAENQTIVWGVARVPGGSELQLLTVQRA